MSKLFWQWMLIALLIGLSLTLVLSSPGAQAEEPAPSRLITGRVYDSQGQPVQGVQVAAVEHNEEALVGLIIYSEFAYRRELRQASATSPMLLEKLAERARITEPAHLRKAGWVGAGMLILFVFGERIHLLPAVTALIGATALLLWIRPDIEEMIEAVDWTTLVFFIALFIVVGAIQEVGLISLIADLIGRLVGDSPILAMLAIVWLWALLSTVVANIPFTAAMLPVVGYLTAIVPGAQNKALFYSLSVGSGMGGNSIVTPS